MIARRFEQQVQRCGSRPALRVAGASISFDQLNRRANRIAHVLARTIDRRQQPIAIVTAETHDAVASMLGILKSGNAWIPMDPALPEDRLTAMIEHAPAATVLTCKRTESLAKAICKGACPVIAVDEPGGTTTDGNLELEVAPTDLACILYTSGSTGVPKGVVHDQQNLMHPVEYWTSRFGITRDDRSLLVATFSHVAAVNDVLRTLLNGACLVPFDLRRSSLQRLAELIDEERITIYHSIPSVFRALARTLEGSRRFSDVRLMHLGGEPLFRSDVELFRRCVQRDCVLVNNLSATEIQTFAQHVITTRTELDTVIVPVGRATKGKRVLLVDDEGREVGTGEAGEIVVQSAFLALGYWKDAPRTAGAFSGDLARRSERTYRTGDLGRRREDGVIEYLGRKDDQIKIRGHRVELAEVQFFLHQAAEELGGIDETTVVPWDTPSASKALVAYLVPRPGASIELSALRRAVARRLAEPMRPETYVILESLPKTTTGKVDRSGLPAPTRPFAKPTSRSGSRTRLAAQVEGLWKQILGLDSIPRDADFFDLGGHSLLALELADEVEKLFGLKITLPELLDSPTLEGLIQLVSERPGQRPWPALVPFKTDGSKTPLFIVHGLGGVVIELREFARTLDPDRPAYALQARGVDGISPRQRRVEDMAATYIEEIRHVRPNGPYVLCGYSMGGIVAFEMAQQLASGGSRVEALILIDTPAPLRLGLRERTRFRWGFVRSALSQLAARVFGRGREQRDLRQGHYLDQLRMENVRAIRRYRVQAYPGPIHHVVSRGAVENGTGGRLDPLLRLFLAKRSLWNRLALGGVATREVIGHHLDLMRRPALEQVIEQVRASLDGPSG